ncbi:hypothetical protein GCM10010967_44230 [Dyadobacter beijingensis]|uniref:DUF86 domain-containing protein n=3 Tax=Dyadobacter beijingensis TaxID=365489 RepID=A0ABQ2ICH5_9BACT|nr:hypothetical protein GCM10010967_44230 [Dyadobacter beijingensis]
MLESMGKIEIYTQHLTTAIDFFQKDDQMQFNASLLLLINIGEQANRLSEEIKSRYSHIPFQQIRGIRNRVAHDYTGIDYELVFDIVNKDLTILKPRISDLLRAEIASGNFDIQELKAAQDSQFYKHIDFKSFAP